MRLRIGRPAEGWLSLLLLAFVLLCPAASVVTADWVDHLSLLYWTVLGGLALGAVLARLRFSGPLLHLPALSLGLAGVYWAVASTVPRTTTAQGQLGVLWRRVDTWLSIVESGGFADEPVVFLLFLAVGSFAAAYISAWLLRRSRTVWWPLLFGGIGLVANVSYAPETLPYLVPFAAAGVLLISRVNLLRQESAWRQAGLRYDVSIWSGTLRAGLVLALLVAGFGWFAPEIPASEEVNDAVYKASGPLRDVQDQFNRAFAGLRQRGGPALSGFGQSMVLSGQFALANHPVLRVASPEAHYWRAVVYDRYTGRGWLVAQPAATLRIEAGQAMPAPLHEGPVEQRAELIQTLEVLQPRGDYVVGASSPTTVDLPVNADVFGLMTNRRRLNPATQLPNLSASALHAPMTAGKTYTVVSSVSRATPAMLREAGTDYPRPLLQRYLRLPRIPQRVRELAASLTEPYANPYDQARAVESYLRTLGYSTEVAPPPAGRDAVDYFLFDSQTGYCDYFSSAMAVMLRSVGIPARVVSGYATGTPNGDGTFEVRDSNAHSWVEVYFPRYGWIEFDPTPALPAVQHPIGYVAPTPTPTPAPLTTPAPEIMPMVPPQYPSGFSATGGLSAAGESSSPLRPIALAVAGLGLLAAALLALWRVGLAGLPPAALAYAQMARLGGLLGWRQGKAETPYEYAGRLASLAPQQVGSFRLLAGAFVALRFGRRGASSVEPPALAAAWLSVRRGLLSAAIARVGRGMESIWQCGRMIRSWRR